MAWTEQMVEDLKRMWKEGLTTGEIGKRLGVTKNSIIGKVHRLQLSGRPSPIKRKEDIAKEKAATAQQSAPAKEEKTKPIKEDKSIPVKEEKSTPLTEEKVTPVKNAEEKISKQTKEINVEPSVKAPIKNNHTHCGKTSLTDLDNHTCRWPIGDPKDENFHFCGKKVKIGQTYCEEHANIAYVKPGKK